MMVEPFASKSIERLTNIDDLFAALTGRKHWSGIPECILRQIFDNANGDIEKLQRFRSVSEIHHCVEDNFIPVIEENSDPKIVLALFSATLERLAAQAAQSVSTLPDGSKEQAIAAATAETAYISSILCNPLILPSYVGLASCYMVFGSPYRVAQVCRDYDKAEQKLLSSDANNLTFYDQAMKSDIPEIRNLVNKVKAQAGIR
jgi:hypothetical protein